MEQPRGHHLPKVQCHSLVNVLEESIGQVFRDRRSEGQPALLMKLSDGCPPGQGLPRVLAEAVALAAALMEMDSM